MNISKIGLLLITLVITLFALIGCGGSGGSGGSTTPVIQTQPVSRVIALGSSVTFSVVSTGGGTLSYQWFKGGSAITGATSSSYTIDSVSSEDVGPYYVTIGNALGTTTSETVTLTLGANGSPVITTQPVPVSVPSGSPASFSVVATGSANVYQWFKDGVSISGATQKTYRIATVNSGSLGNYQVRITNPNGSVDSNSVALTIAAPTAPTITTQPVSRSVGVGVSTSLSVVATGTTPLAYQWYKDSNPLPGRTFATLTLSSPTVSDSGTYYVVVTNSLGSATSSSATLDVQPLPVITTQPVSTVVFAGFTATFSVVATGPNLTYTWRKIGGSTVGTGPSLTLTASTLTAGSYLCQVSNAAGSVNSATASLTLGASPTITVQPTPLTVGEGSTATFTVTATGDGTLTYQWFKNGAAISGATNATYVITAAQLSDAADYRVTVTNPGGSATSNTVALTVLSPPVITSQPTSLTVTAGSSAAFTVVATASGTLTYQWYKNGVLITGATGSTYSIATTVLADAGNYRVVVTNAGVASTTSNTVTLTVN